MIDNIIIKADYIKNHTDLDDFKNSDNDYITKLKIISYSIFSKYEQLNAKFNNLYENAKKKN
jgi:hypothetical protein